MILIADTDLVTAGVVAYYLLREGYEVRTVKSGTELLEEAIESVPELIIMDILLPDMNGLEITRTLKANKKTKHIPILIHSFLDAPDKAKEAGADAFLLKPVKPAKMMQVVEELLSGRRFKEVRYG